MTKPFANIWLPLTAMLLSACAAKPERITLLPSPSGQASAVVVTSAAGAATLSVPYAEAVVARGEIATGLSDAASVEARYGATIAAIPPRVQRFTVYFEFGGEALTAAAEPEIARLMQSIDAHPAVEIVVTGHTDRVGALAFNDALSLKRAQLVKDMLIRRGLPAERIAVHGRGEREPLVPTEDEANEPRNRRVEIKLR